MTKKGHQEIQQNSGAAGMSRREALQMGAGALIAVASLAMGSGEFANLAAQGLGPPVIPPPATDPRYPMPPSWKTELRQLAPHVYAYNQGGGPGVVNQGVSNAGLIEFSDHLLAIDALQGPIPAKAFIAAAQKATGGKPFARLVNTHHHGDHVLGNQFFPDATEIISQDRKSVV